MYLISACLAGVNSKYNGENNLNEKVLELVKENKAILVCPEQLGGLSTPRLPSEIVNNCNKTKVLASDGRDITREFLKGADETLKIARIMNIKKAILKSRSPSCGYGKIYDGSFSKKLIDGNGITADLLEKNDIEIINEEMLEKIISKEKTHDKF